jgi:DNA-binding Lrp family transcriptional regulator
MEALGSYSVPKTLSARAGLTQTDKVLLTIIASESTPKRAADHTHQQLATKLGVSRSTAARRVKRLEKLQFVQIQVCPPPLGKFKARCIYTMPGWVWRMFMRGWAMCGPKWRKLSKGIHDHLEQFLPLHFLSGLGLGTREGKNGWDPRTIIQQDYNLSQRSVREPHLAPDDGNQLSFAELLNFVDCEPVRRNLDKGREFLAGVLSPGFFRDRLCA